MKNVKDIQTELAELREENKRLRAAAQRPVQGTEKEAAVAWALAVRLLEQVQTRDEQCAFWVVSALSKLARTHPRRPVVEVLGLARHAMPDAYKQYIGYVAGT